MRPKRALITNNTKTNGYALSVNSGTSSTLTFDANGNMTSDGTNSYSWDAENRMIQITYPGTGNNSQFGYDGSARNVSIVETISGSVTSTKQFVWCGSDRCEARNSSSIVTSQYFALGETISGVAYFYSKDRPGSVREMSNTSGIVQAQYCYDPYGKASKLQGSLVPDFMYDGYYEHSLSGFNLAVYRAYNPNLARWMNRDPLEEEGGVNMFEFVGNNSINGMDLLGLDYSGGGQNCLGYFCGQKNAILPSPFGDSLNDIVSKYGWKCHPLKCGEPCKCGPGERRGMGFVRSSNSGDPFYGKWQGSGSNPQSPNDYHFIYEQTPGMPPLNPYFPTPGPGWSDFNGAHGAGDEAGHQREGIPDPDLAGKGYDPNRRQCCCHP